MGIKMSQAFPSKYLAAADLGGRDIEIVISHVAMEEIQRGETKPVIYFIGAQKGMVLNKTNGSNISSMYGDDADGWANKKITLFTAYVDFQGRTVPAIRVKPIAMAGEQAPLPSDTSIAGPDDPLGRNLDDPLGRDLDDEIPF